MKKMHLKILLLITMVSLILPSNLWANLLVNPGFETGDFTGWTYDGYFVEISDVNPHAGNYHAAISYGGIYQNVDVVAGQSYKLTTWVYVPDEGVVGGILNVDFYDSDSNVVGSWLQDALDLPKSQYSEVDSDWLVASVDAVRAEISATAATEPGITIDYDDFDFWPIPEPSSLILFGSGVCGLLSFFLKIRKTIS